MSIDGHPVHREEQEDKLDDQDLLRLMRRAEGLFFCATVNLR